MMNGLKPKIVPFQPWHVERLGNPPGPAGMNVRALAHTYANGGPAFTALLDNRRIIGSAGLLLLGPGIGFGWALFGPLIHTYPLWVTRTARQLMNETITNLGLTYVYMMIPPEDRMGVRWAEALGMVENPDRVNYRVYERTG